MVVVEEGTGVEDIGRATCEEGQMGSEDVVDATAEDAKNGEGGVKSSVSVVGGGGVHLAAAAHAGECIEHTRAAKADYPNKNNLNQR